MDSPEGDKEVFFTLLKNCVISIYGCSRVAWFTLRTCGHGRRFSGLLGQGRIIE